jgi:NIMA-interacting peptidyl-prolyl cis-trans isomerase 4
LEKLKEGVKFDEVARTYSEDKARQGMSRLCSHTTLVNFEAHSIIGGALGWKTKGSLDPAFEEIAFALDTSTTSSPKYAEVKTGHGYHIIMVGPPYTCLDGPNIIYRSRDGSRMTVHNITCQARRTS